MKILFFGDSITDASRVRGSTDAGRVAETPSGLPTAYGSGYVFLTAAQLYYEKPNYYEVLNRGIGGDRLPQLYARIQLDVWNENPDVLSILVGVNDVDTGKNPNGTDLARWGRIYRMLIEDTKRKCPSTQIIICEPFTVNEDSKAGLKPYAEETRWIAKEFGLPFVALQDKFDKAVEIYGVKACCYDLTHPCLVGSKIISDAWLEVFNDQIINTKK